jgi:hypothetical protein
VDDRKRPLTHQYHQNAIGGTKKHGHITLKANNRIHSLSHVPLRLKRRKIGTAYNRYVVSVDLVWTYESVAEMTYAQGIEHAQTILCDSICVITAHRTKIERRETTFGDPSTSFGEGERDPARTS